MPVKSKHSPKITSQRESARPARLVKIRPVGYPIKELHRNYYINIESPELFELYAKEQWMGSLVAVEEYLFDQRVIPDFAFQVIKVLPLGTVKINENTLIELEQLPPKKESSTDRNKIKLENVIGHEKVKKKCRIVMRYLEEPEVFGDWAPKNILFHGPPGTGKTMTAKALANEVDAWFFLVRATDLVGEFVGDGSKRIHDLYKAAQNQTPSIIFIDELDAIALDRSYQNVRGDVSEVVNALLSELDGIKENLGVVTIGATNTPLLLDRAIRNRFEEELHFVNPNEFERLRILEGYGKTMPLELDADMRMFARKTKGFSGRALREKLLKSALYKAMLEESPKIRSDHLEAALKEIDQTQSKAPKEMFT